MSSKPLSNHDVTSGDYETTTTSNMTPSIDITSQKTAATVLCVFLLLCAIYLLIALSYFEHQKRIKASLRNSTKEKNMRILCLCAATFMLFRYIFEMVEICESEFYSSPCVWVRHVKLLMLTGSAVCAYLVLWLRQRVFYEAPILEDLSNNITKTCSFAVVFFMVATVSIPATIYLAAVTFGSSDTGCSVVSSAVWSSLPGVLYYILALSFQTILISLFIYPQWKQHKAPSLIKNKEGRIDLIRLIKRVGNATIVAVATTSAAGLLSLAILNIPGTYHELLHILLDFDLLINLLSVIFSFFDWKTRLVPFRLEQNEAKKGNEDAVPKNTTTSTV